MINNLERMEYERMNNFNLQRTIPYHTIQSYLSPDECMKHRLIGDGSLLRASNMHACPGLGIIICLGWGTKQQHADAGESIDRSRALALA